MTAWTTHEIKRLKGLYLSLTESELELAFYPRSISSIRYMANRSGLRKRRDWKAIAQDYKPAFFGPSRVQST